MAHNIELRDIQAAKSQAWHGLTTIVDEVTRSNSMNWDVIKTPVLYKIPGNEELGIEPQIIQHPSYSQLIATDDLLPVGEPFGDSYCPTSVDMFWEIIKKGMGDTPYEIISAGSVEDRRKIFVSLKVSEGFRVRDREFKDYITLLDSFDKSTSLQARYSSICVVCANTYNAAMNSGETIGKAKHTAMIELNVQRLIDAIEAFSGTSHKHKEMLTRADATPCSRDEARAWAAGLEGRNMDRATNGLVQKVARIAELFDGGRGNSGRTRLDAMSAITDFHTNESTNRKGNSAQFMTSEFGASAATKTLAVTRLEADWDKHRRHGERLLEDKTVLTA